MLLKKGSHSEKNWKGTKNSEILTLVWGTIVQVEHLRTPLYCSATGGGGTSEPFHATCLQWQWHHNGEAVHASRWDNSFMATISITLIYLSFTSRLFLSNQCFLFKVDGFDFQIISWGEGEIMMVSGALNSQSECILMDFCLLELSMYFLWKNHVLY